LEGRSGVLVWLPESSRIGLIQNRELVSELDSFCSSKLSPTIPIIQNTKKGNLPCLIKQQKKSELKFIQPTWSNEEFPKTLYNLLPPSSQNRNETYILHYRNLKSFETIEYTRMHEISEFVGVEGVVRIMNLGAPFPGKRPHLQFEGYFEYVDESSAMLISLYSRHVFQFQAPSIVQRLLKRHGNSKDKSIFRIEKMEGGKWLLKGVNPFVPTSTPNPRPFSINYNSLKEARTPTDDSSLETRLMTADASESLHKASQSSSSLTSSSRKADMGSTSIKVPLHVGSSTDSYKVMTKEMKMNSRVMDQLRYMQQTAILLCHVMSQTYLALSQVTSNTLTLKSRFKTDSCLEVSLIYLIVLFIVGDIPYRYYQWFCSNAVFFRCDR
jgi:hypothetical protein